jgi:hypothetical protein
VDFKTQAIELDGKTIKLHIRDTWLVRNGTRPSLPAATRILMSSLWCMMSLTKNPMPP